MSAYLALTENHRHLSGSIKPETIWEIIQRTDRLDVANSLDDVRDQVCLRRPDADFNYFCTRFDILNKLSWDHQSLKSIAQQVCAGLRAEQITCATLTVSLNKFAVNGDLITAGERVFSVFNEAAAGLQLNYLLSVSYSWPLALQVQTLHLAEDLSQLIAGVDFVSDEFKANWDVYPELLKPWHKLHKMIRAHVGERLGTCGNIQKAVDNLKVTRIAHGIYGTVKQWRQAAQLGIVFDLSLHSNTYTNAISLAQHPIKQMLDAGCQITLGTDDPVQFNCTLQDEYDLASALGVDTEALYLAASELRII